ncbi:plasmid pRiA4b ORF-3 family protein [Jatrophihabitans sp. YIM 134969]
MDPTVEQVVDRLRATRSTTWLRLLDDARLDEPATPGDDAAAVVEPYRWFLERIGGGVKLSQAGWLPPALVVEMMDALGESDRFWGKGNRENLAIPAMLLRESATRYGLVRKYRGQLLPTRVGRGFVTDPTGLWWHLASKLPDGRVDSERHAGTVALLMTAAGRAINGAELADAMAVLGWWMGSYEPLTPFDAQRAARDTTELFRRLRLVSESWNHEPPPPSPGAVALARAALIGREAPPRRAPAPAAGQTLELTVTLRDVEPPVWRRLVVPSSLTLAKTHEVLLTAMGWQGYHLHMFDVGGTLYGDVEDFDGPLGEEDAVTLADLRRVTPRLTWEYDFGDGWTHDVELGALGIGSSVPRVVAGARACPPEDCGGPGGYEELLMVLADPADDEHGDLLEWLGGAFDPEAFDLDAKNANLELLDRQTRPR